MVEIRFSTPQDVHSYVQALSKRKVEDDPSVKAWQLAKQTVYLYTLIACFLIYFLIDVMTETLSIPAIHFSLPVKQASNTERIQHPNANSSESRPPSKSLKANSDRQDARRSAVWPN